MSSTKAAREARTARSMIECDGDFDRAVDHMGPERSAVGPKPHAGATVGVQRRVGRDGIRDHGLNSGCPRAFRSNRRARLAGPRGFGAPASLGTRGVHKNTHEHRPPDIRPVRYHRHGGNTKSEQEESTAATVPGRDAQRPHCGRKVDAREDAGGAVRVPDAHEPVGNGPLGPGVRRVQPRRAAGTRGTARPADRQQLDGPGARR